jgi:hypothetical protein
MSPTNRDQSDPTLPQEPASEPVAYYARKGEQVTCENDHVICEVARDLPVGARQQPGDFHRWRDPEPRIGTVATDAPCCRCGAIWFGNDSGCLHFKDGWR